VTHKEILLRAVELATASGWHSEYTPYFKVHTHQHVNSFQTWISFEYDNGSLGHSSITVNFETIIYGRAFANALWGNGDYTETRNGPVTNRVEHKKSWQRHLQAMVVADDPIKYLGENLPK
jgi:hypothetical protein